MKGCRPPKKEQLLRGIREFEKRETRDAMYKVSTDVISRYWGDPEKMANAIGVLLLTWNQAFYRYAPFDFDRLEVCIKKNLKALSKFRRRSILTFSDSDERAVVNLFNDFLKALKTSKGRTPVGAVKALHLLAPSFFPLWDDRISRAYHCYYSKNPAKKYIDFFRMNQKLAKNSGLESYSKKHGKTIPKLIDEYNYAKYTWGWV